MPETTMDEPSILPHKGSAIGPWMVIYAVTADGMWASLAGTVVDQLQNFEILRDDVNEHRRLPSKNTRSKQSLAQIQYH